MAEINRDKVIKGLEICYCHPSKCEDCPYHDLPDEQSCSDVLCLDALSLLKEQEPKPVELHTNAYGTRFYFCPKCKRELFHTRNLNFCERCGQAVKWDG